LIIYKATNLVNGKVYIGQTIRPLKVRIREHNHTSKEGPFKTYFYRAIKKHGKENFKWDVIDTASDIDELNDKEEYWIDVLDSTNKNVGYNNKKGGKNGSHLPAARKKISEANMGRIHSPETRRKLSIANKGQVPWTKGKKYTIEKKRKIAMSQKARIISLETAIEIKMLIHQGTGCAKIARDFNISVHIIHNIKADKSWRHVPWPDGYIKKHDRRTLSDPQAVEVKRLLSAGERNIDIAKKFNVTEYVICGIKNNKTWRHIPWP
jgi:group I intron endonuclease